MPVEVFSIGMPTMGHRTVGETLARELARSEAITFESAWFNDRPEPLFRLINRALWQHAPIAAIRRSNVDFRRLRGDIGMSLLAKRLIERRLAESPIDVLHLHTQNLGLTSANIARRVPTVVTTDMTNEQIALEYPPALRYTLAPGIALERRLIARAAAIVTFSRWASDSFSRDYGIDPARLHVIPIGVDTASFARLRLDERRPDEPVRILFIGGDFERKGGPLLVDVFLRFFTDANVELHLMTGFTDIPEHPKIVVHRNVTAGSPEWRSIVADADVFALPSRHEAFGIAYVEALAAGLPVVGSRVSAAHEIVSDDVGFLIAPDDAEALGARLRRLVDDPELRRRMGDAGRARAARLFDARTNAERLADVFVSVAGSEPGKRSSHA